MTLIPDLNSIAANIVSAINPWTTVTIQISQGSITSEADGSTVPQFSDPFAINVQVQPIGWKDLQQLNGMNIQGIRWKLYLDGELNGVVRPELKGGDLVNILSGRHKGKWLVNQVLEQWDAWVCAAITLQNGA